MNNALKKNIRNYVESQSISVNTFEKRAGLKPTAVHNILLGRSKNPSVGVLNKISKAIGCTIDNLITEYPYAFPLSNSTQWNGNLYCNVANAVNQKVTSSNIIISQHIATQCIVHAYEYAIKKHNTIDENFIDWIIGELNSK